MAGGSSDEHSDPCDLITELAAILATNLHAEMAQFEPGEFKDPDAEGVLERARCFLVRNAHHVPLIVDKVLDGAPKPEGT
ncbi:hypothetical protein [Methylobacterium dankookense]|uniref:Uncharacterized protein n=1 Tax=Methylobacterium dankookense TaxID=560405 RepID=A0A564G1E1_9HYPH|nr:hypothetical protein [Methylobacterium dankookense]GJD55519.1 hypothetical protein IFDJLNFL_1405 [Methylobacterium dankookense]VUF14303.1 hypothetical protein MTDSW087_04021 [Methylobacterium dankookense]